MLKSEIRANLKSKIQADLVAKCSSAEAGHAGLDTGLRSSRAWSTLA